MNTSAQPDREKEIFEQAVEITSPEERRVFLDLACSGKPALRARVDALLHAHADASQFLGETSPAKGTIGLPAPDAEGVGTFIGRYKLLERIGEGGFGVVYVAEQCEPVKRRVALKVIKLGMDTREVVARFEAERQALAMMDHSNIAKVLDAGATETGRPYFVMELVRGIRITDYCDQNQLGMNDRLRLFILVCHAVQHAHQKGIIHRDLKPSNILVTLHDGVPVPKVIDFGIAKATQQEPTEKTVYTRLQQFIGTPAYISPEQAEMSGLDIDTRADIYSLGVLLYEILTGQTPFDTQALLKAGFDELRRTLREQEPLRPSTKLNTLQHADLTTTARRRGSDAPKLVNLLRGDLDWIVMKCLEKDRARRYETAGSLAADLQRHLGDEPVVARPPSAAYRFKKMVRRNRLTFAAAAVVSIALLAGIAVSSWQAARAGRERARAERRLQASLAFIDRVFDSVSPDVNTLIGGAKANRELATSGLRLMDEFRKDADSSPAFRLTLSRLLTQLAFTQSWPVGNTAGDYEAGLKSATEAILLLQPSGSEPFGDTQASRLARAEMVAGYASLALLRHEEALSHFRRMEQLASRLALSTNKNPVAEGREFKRWAPICIGDVLLEMGPPNVRRAIDEQFLPLLAELREAAGSSHSTSNSLLWELRCVADDLGVAYSKLNNPKEALPHFREAHRLVSAKAEQKPNNADIAHVLVEAGAKLGEMLLTLQQPEEGVRLLDASLEQAEALVKRDPANVGFRQLRITVLGHCALGTAAWSGDPSGTPAERHRRLEKAQANLDRAETLLASLPAESARKRLRPYLEQARTQVAAARARLQASDAQPNPERGTEP